MFLRKKKANEGFLKQNYVSKRKVNQVFLQGNVSIKQWLIKSWEVGISCNPAYGGLALRWNHSWMLWLRHEVEADLRPHKCLLPCEIKIHDFLLTALPGDVDQWLISLHSTSFPWREGRGFKSRPRRNPEGKLAVRTTTEVKAPSSASSWAP